jgi:hypothetical protein
MNTFPALWSIFLWLGHISHIHFQCCTCTNIQGPSTASAVFHGGTPLPLSWQSFPSLGGHLCKVPMFHTELTLWLTFKLYYPGHVMAPTVAFDSNFHPHSCLHQVLSSLIPFLAPLASILVCCCGPSPHSRLVISFTCFNSLSDATSLACCFHLNCSHLYCFLIATWLFLKWYM